MHRTWSRAPGKLACTSACTAVVLNLLALPAARADHDIGVIEITGERVEPAETREQGFAPTPGPTPDTAGLLKRMPGANVNRNGALTGIAQYRGLFGERVNVQVDGMRLDASCPNAMDPPLSHIPHTQLERLTLIRGIAPVSSGAETLGGTLRVESEGSEFGFGSEFENHADVEASAGSVNNRTGLGVGLSRANDTHRMHLQASHEQGDDTEFDGGKLLPTEFERRNLAVGYGFTRAGHAFGLELRRNETDDTGTPSLPMDIIYMDGNSGGLDYAGRLAGLRVTAKVYGNTVEHRMDNYSLRTPVDPTKRRYSDVDSDGLGFRLDAAHALGAGELQVGVDGHLVDHAAVIKSPDNAMFRVENFNDVERDLLGLFAEWRASFGADWDLEAGARVNRVSMDAGTVSHSMAMMNPSIAALVSGFNNADRSVSDTNFDWVLQLTRHVSKDFSLHAGIARKMRSPSYQERYLWLPLQATGGLADGNNYVGDINLDPETSHQLELGLDWGNGRGYVSPRIFYREVDDYIQGTPATDATVIMVSTMGGDATPLQYSNVDARLWGLDAGWGLTLNNHWQLDGVISYVRDEREDTDDDLYRIAPPNLRVGLTHRHDNWSATLEGVAYAGQDDVSATNGETETGGYGLINLSGEYRLGRDTRVLAGVDNLLDRTYREHLNGYNRAVNPDIAIGERLPGAGRNLYVSLSHRW